MLACQGECAACSAQQNNRFGVEPGPDAVEGQIDGGLQVALEGLALQVPGPPIQRVERQRGRQELPGFAFLAKLAQHNGFEVAGARVVSVETQRTLQVLEGQSPMPTRAINFRQSVIGCAGPRLVPNRFIKGIVGLALSAQISQAHAQIVVRFAVIRIGIAASEPLDGSPEVLFGEVKFPAPKLPEAHSIVATSVQRIAAQGFVPIERRAARRMAVLLEVQAGDEELVGALDFVGRGRLRGRRRHRPMGTRLGLIQY